MTINLRPYAGSSADDFVGRAGNSSTVHQGSTGLSLRVTLSHFLSSGFGARSDLR